MKAGIIWSPANTPELVSDLQFLIMDLEVKSFSPRTLVGNLESEKQIKAERLRITFTANDKKEIFVALYLAV